EPRAYGAYPEYEFDHQERPYDAKRKGFVIPDLSLPEGVDPGRFGGRMEVLKGIDSQRKLLDAAANAGASDHARQDAVSALLDDLTERGLLDSTLIVMAGEFGRTPRVSTLTQFYKGPGRDHWGAVQSLFLAGGGVTGGRVVGSSDKSGGYPATDPQTPE